MTLPGEDTRFWRDIGVPWETITPPTATVTKSGLPHVDAGDESTALADRGSGLARRACRGRRIRVASGAGAATAHGNGACDQIALADESVESRALAGA